MVIQKPLKKVYKASESMNVGCCRLCKSVGDTRNLGEIFTAKPESTTSGRGRGAFIRRRTSTGHIYFVGGASEDRIILESSSPRYLKVRYHLN